MKIGESIKITTLSYWPDKEFEILGCFIAKSERYDTYRLIICADVLIDFESNLYGYDLDNENSLILLKPNIIKHESKEANKFLANVDAIIDFKVTQQGYTGTFIKFKK